MSNSKFEFTKEYSDALLKTFGDVQKDINNGRWGDILIDDNNFNTFGLDKILAKNLEKIKNTEVVNSLNTPQDHIIISSSNNVLENNNCSISNTNNNNNFSIWNKQAIKKLFSNFSGELSNIKDEPAEVIKETEKLDNIVKVEGNVPEVVQKIRELHEQLKALRQERIMYEVEKRKIEFTDYIELIDTVKTASGFRKSWAQTYKLFNEHVKKLSNDERNNYLDTGKLHCIQKAHYRNYMAIFTTKLQLYAFTDPEEIINHGFFKFVKYYTFQTTKKMQTSLGTENKVKFNKKNSKNNNNSKKNNNSTSVENNVSNNNNTSTNNTSEVNVVPKKNKKKNKSNGGGKPLEMEKNSSVSKE